MHSHSHTCTCTQRCTCEHTQSTLNVCMGAHCVCMAHLHAHTCSHAPTHMSPCGLLTCVAQCIVCFKDVFTCVICVCSCVHLCANHALHAYIPVCYFYVLTYALCLFCVATSCVLMSSHVRGHSCVCSHTSHVYNHAYVHSHSCLSVCTCVLNAHMDTHVCMCVNAYVHAGNLYAAMLKTMFIHTLASTLTSKHRPSHVCPFAHNNP